MKYFTRLLHILILFHSTAAFAYDFGAGSIEIPAGFEGPETKPVRDLGMIHDFIKQHPGTDSGTLLQITVYDFGQKLRPVPDSLMLAAAEDHLLDFTAGLSRHHSDFNFKKMRSLKIDNTSTAHIEWTGNSDGRAMHGTAYCLVKGSKVVIFHVKDASDMPLQNTIDALKALAAADLKD